MIKEQSSAILRFEQDKVELKAKYVNLLYHCIILMKKEKTRELAHREGLEAQYHQEMGSKDGEIQDLHGQVVRLEAAKQEAFENGCEHAEAKMTLLLDG